MRQYLDIVQHVLDNGKEKKPVRIDANGVAHPVDGGIGTIAAANVLFSHDMKYGFPLLTTKRMATTAIFVELEGFIKGITSKKWYQDRKCRIWNEWCNPNQLKQYKDEDGSWNWRLRENPDGTMKTDNEIRKERQLYEDDLGPIYGFQWRRFNEAYDEDDGGNIEGYDQFKRIVDTLHTNYNDRRMVCSAWNPLQMDKMALPPCHWGWNITVVGEELNLFWVQRSCDLMLGVPFNIASYGMLLTLLAKEANLRVGNLSGMLVDCHIYENQIDAAREQLTREPRPLPHLSIPDTEDGFDIFKWEANQVVINNYDPHPKLDFGAVAV